jgi:hypothetical protein
MVSGIPHTHIHIVFAYSNLVFPNSSFLIYGPTQITSITFHNTKKWYMFQFLFNFLTFHLYLVDVLYKIFSCLTFTFSLLNQEVVKYEWMSLRGLSSSKMSFMLEIVLVILVKWGTHHAFLLRNDRATLVCQRLRCGCCLRCSRNSQD